MGTYKVIVNANSNYAFSDGTISKELACTISPSSQNFDFINGEQKFTAPVAGYYKLEVWGAQGGNAGKTDGDYDITKVGGYGAYAVGVVYLNANDSLFVNVGGAGSSLTAKSASSKLKKAGGYNGGGTVYLQTGNNNSGGFHSQGSGGGATHIATVSGQLSTLSSNTSSILIVAGGGGGATCDHGKSAKESKKDKCESGDGNGPGGNAGGIKGNRGNIKEDIAIAGGIQTVFVKYEDKTGITYINNGKFGKGGNTQYTESGTKKYYYGGAGGGGYYGGGGNKPSKYRSGGGGSSYIGNSKLISYNGLTKSMYCYECETSTASTTYTISNTNVSSNPTSGYSKQGNGYAIITFIGN